MRAAEAMQLAAICLEAALAPHRCGRTGDWTQTNVTAGRALVTAAGQMARRDGEDRAARRTNLYGFQRPATCVDFGSKEASVARPSPCREAVQIRIGGDGAGRVDSHLHESGANCRLSDCDVVDAKTA